MNILRIILLAVLVGNLAHAEEAIPWMTDLKAAEKIAAETKRPLLLDFTAGWCGPCQMMNNTTFTDPKVAEAMRAVVPVRIDFDKNMALVARYQVSAIPAFVIMNAKGDVRGRSVGYKDARTFVGWLDTMLGEKESIGAMPVPPETVKMVRDLEERAKSGDKSGVEELVGLASAKTPMAQDALRRVAEKQKSLVRSYLNDERLPVRIAAFNALEPFLPKDSEYDPWASAAERREVLKKIP